MPSSSPSPPPSPPLDAQALRTDLDLSALGVRQPMRDLALVDFDRFYAHMVSKMDDERRLFDDYLSLIQPKQLDSHNLEWESRKLLEDARLAQQESEKITSTALAVERQLKETQIQTEEELRIQALRQEQISRLQVLGRPVEHDVTYLVPDRFPRHARPAVAKGGRSSGSDRSTQRTQDTPLVVAEALERTQWEKTQRQLLYKVIKTGEVLQLEQRLQQERMHSAAALDQLLSAVSLAREDRHRQAVMYEGARSSDRQDAVTLWTALDDAEFHCFYVVAELLRLRQHILSAQREEMHELELLLRDREAFAQKEERTKDELVYEMEAMQKKMEQELQQNIEDLDIQHADLQLRIDHQRRLETELLQRFADDETRHRHRQERLQLAKERYLHLRRRYALEMEGYQSEALQLRQKLRSIEKLLDRRSADK